jgi:hypothetical protein
MPYKDKNKKYEYYKNNATQKKWQACKMRKILEKIRTIKSQPCHDCKNVYHPCVMDFDHRPGTVKFKNVSKMIGYAWWRIQQEIDKCDIVCANCHRIRTENRRLEKEHAGAIML